MVAGEGLNGYSQTSLVSSSNTIRLARRGAWLVLTLSATASSTSSAASFKRVIGHTGSWLIAPSIKM